MGPRHSPCEWAPDADGGEVSGDDEDESETMSGTNPPHPSTTLALTAPAPDHPQDGVSDAVGHGRGRGLVSDGGGDGEGDAEAILSQIIAIHDHFVEIGYTNHLVVLAAVAVLNEAGVQPTKLKPILRVANQLATATTFDRYNIETSLSALYGEDDEVGFVDRECAARGNAYHWFVTEEGREAIAFLYELGIIDELATSDLTAGID